MQGCPATPDPPRALAPMLATATDVLPSGAGWAFEPKWDGYRALARVSGGAATLRSRNGNDLTARFRRRRPCARPRRALAVRRARRRDLRARRRRAARTSGVLQRGEGAISFVAFDLLELDGEPLAAPQATWSGGSELARLLDPSAAGVLLSPSFDDGAALEQAAREHGLEGVVAKRVPFDLPTGPPLARLAQAEAETSTGSRDRGLHARQGPAQPERYRGTRPGGARHRRVALRRQRRNGAQATGRSSTGSRGGLAPLRQKEQPVRRVTASSTRASRER